MRRRELRPYAFWRAAALFLVVAWTTWELVRRYPAPVCSTCLGWTGVGIDPNLPFEREYGYFGFLRVRDIYSDFFNGRLVSGQVKVWRFPETYYTISAIVVVWLVAGLGWLQVGRRPDQSPDMS